MTKPAVKSIKDKLEKKFGSIPSLVKKLYGIDIPPDEGWAELPVGWSELGPYDEIGNKDVIFLNTLQRWLSVTRWVAGLKEPRPTIVGKCVKFITWKKTTTIASLRKMHAYKMWEADGKPEGKEDSHYAEACVAIPDNLPVRFARQKKDATE